MSSNPPRIDYVGVSWFTDLYPNVRYKAEVLAELAELRRCVHDLGAGSLYSGIAGKDLFSKIRLLCSMVFGHIRVFTHALWRRGESVYITYPAVFLVCLYTLLPRSRRPRIIMDTFISLYDSSVRDRQILRADSWRARLLLRLEKHALSSADVVLVDTRDNGDYYARLFALPRSTFVEMPLTIPDLEPLPVKTRSTGQFVCLFMGSMVPLQGIGTVLAAATLLRDDPDIDFRLIGDGQQGNLVEEYLASHVDDRVQWERRMLPTDELIAQISEADLCLGIFGDTAKADRVIPYKLYYYAALGKPFLSMNSTALSRLAPAELVCHRDAEVLAARIRQLKGEPEAIIANARASRRLFDDHLSRKVQVERCRELLTVSSQQAEINGT